MRRPANWLQLVRFGLVGGVGFVVNLLVYTLFVHGAGVEYRVAIGRSRGWSRCSTTSSSTATGRSTRAAGRRASRRSASSLVSLVAEVFSLLLLTLLVEAGGLAKVPAQALAVAAVDAAELPRQQALELPSRA